MPDGIDLDRYFERIGFAGEARPDLASLTALHALHVAAIPFEALDPLVGRPVSLGLDALQAKLVASRRGGYCFEQNTLFKAVLEAIGFSVTGLGGRVVWMSPPGAPLGARTHMVLRVDLEDGPWLADVGFGAQLLDAPLRLEVGREQATPMGCWRLQQEGDFLVLAARQDDGWRRAYAFDFAPQLPADYALANWFTSTSPQVPFTNTLILERLTPEARHNLVGLRLSERRCDGTRTERVLADAAELATALEEVFGIEPPIAAEALYARLASTGA